MIEGQVSSPLPLTSGVPQCSNIGQLLFVLWINDICDVCTSFMKLYADDAKLYPNVSQDKMYFLFRMILMHCGAKFGE